MRLMITGGRGMVGRNLCEHPSASGYDILAPTRAELDLADSSAVQAYVASNKPDMIIHAAGTVGGIQANIEAPVKFLMENLAVGSNLIMAARADSSPRMKAMRLPRSPAPSFAPTYVRRIRVSFTRLSCPRTFMEGMIIFTPCALT